MSSVLLLVTTVATRGFGILLAPVPVLFAYLVLCVSSSYSIAYIKLLKKEGKINIPVPHIILQFCFVLDIIDIVFLLQTVKKGRR